MYTHTPVDFHLRKWNACVQYNAGVVLFKMKISQVCRRTKKRMYMSKNEIKQLLSWAVKLRALFLTAAVWKHWFLTSGSTHFSSNPTLKSDEDIPISNLWNVRHLLMSDAASGGPEWIRCVSNYYYYNYYYCFQHISLRSALTDWELQRNAICVLHAVQKRSVARCIIHTLNKHNTGEVNY